MYLGTKYVCCATTSCEGVRLEFHTTSSDSEKGSGPTLMTVPRGTEGPGLAHALALPLRTAPHDPGSFVTHMTSLVPTYGAGQSF